MTTSPASATDALGLASLRLVRSVDALPDQAWSQPSLLPGWTRAHVVAHLALNAEAYAGGVTGVLEGRPVPMYSSDEQRDADIADLAAAEPAQLRDRLFTATTLIHDALATLATEPSLAETLVHRTPGSARHFPAGLISTMRLREVEIHHVDLDVGYSPGDWSTDFAAALIAECADRQSLGATLVATDLGRSWTLGELGEGATARPTVSGPACGLAWWLTGRTPYPGVEVTSDDGVLPGIEGL